MLKLQLSILNSKGITMFKISYFLIIICICIATANLYSLNVNDNTQDTITEWSARTPELNCKGIPDSVYQMISLRILSVIGEDCDVVYQQNDSKSVRCCFLKEISPKIKNLINLEELHLPLSGFESLPNEIIECKNLKKIDLTDGIIKNIDNLTKLPNLESLSLFGNHLKKLPDNIADMKKLKYLGLKGNQLTKQEIARIRKALPDCEIIY